MTFKSNDKRFFLEEKFWSTKFNKEKGKVIVANARRAKLIIPLAPRRVLFLLNLLPENQLVRLMRAIEGYFLIGRLDIYIVNLTHVKMAAVRVRQLFSEHHLPQNLIIVFIKHDL